MAFTLPPLPYANDALEPTIDAMTMEIHHDRHHQAYVNNLNAAVEGTKFADMDIVELMKNLDSVRWTSARLSATTAVGMSTTPSSGSS